MRFSRIAAHDDLSLRIAEVSVAGGHRAVAPGIGHAGDGGRMADARLMVGIVGAPECPKLPEQVGTFVGHLGRAEPIDRVTARLLADRYQFVADLVDRLVPLDASPLAVDELHRIFQAPLAHHQFAHRGALGAMRATVDRRIPARLLADPDAIRNFGGDGAADRAMRADALADSDAGALGGRRAGLGLPHAGERQGAKRGKAADSEARTAQEAAAVQPTVILAGKGGEISASRLAVCSLDQHGGSPSARITVDAIE